MLKEEKKQLRKEISRRKKATTEIDRKEWSKRLLELIENHPLSPLYVVMIALFLFLLWRFRECFAFFKYLQGLLYCYVALVEILYVRFYS